MTACASVQVLMVCLGNICRSPTAEGVFRYQLQQAGLGTEVLVDSAGTSNWHCGDAPDPRTIAAAARRGYDLSVLRARQVQRDDYTRFDYILAMDRQNLHDLERQCPPEHRHKLALLLSHGSGGIDEVPDPYERDGKAFDTVLDLCEDACASLLQHLIGVHGLRTRSTP